MHQAMEFQPELRVWGNSIKLEFWECRVAYIFVIYSDQHSETIYQMYNMKTKRIIETRDI